MRDHDDPLSEFPSEADGAKVEKDGPLETPLNKQKSGTQSLLAFAPPEAPIDETTDLRPRRRARLSPAAWLLRRATAVAFAVFAWFDALVCRASAACRTSLAALGGSLVALWRSLAVPCRQGLQFATWIRALSGSTHARVTGGAAHVSAAAAVVRRRLTVLWCDWNNPAWHLNESLRTWRHHAGSIRPFVLGIIVGGLMVGYQRVMPDQRVTAFVPASEAVPARPEAGSSPALESREDVITSASSAQRPGASLVVSTAGSAAPDDRGPLAPGPKPRGQAPRPPRPQPYRGSLLVTSTPQGAAVFINGRPAGTTPVVLANLPVGSRAVRVSLEGYDRWSRAVQVVADRRTEVNAVLTVPRPVEAEPRGSE